ncbi:hypothetical protein GCM10011588_39300 [Nocardia jinanensis]|uniref:Uncharacterized protein n=1 Tax=Nocardia jinanensis TaxID=382504 RepID=A0A917RRJ1_9NOCA|nr:hypothetical protein GCM10011588_39300 [Nocardia jinanensis]
MVTAARAAHTTVAVTPQHTRLTESAPPEILRGTGLPQPQQLARTSTSVAGQELGDLTAPKPTVGYYIIDGVQGDRALDPVLRM